jgi:antibiotic biosynthesis monooxygenase (ABM) superfamily enzyme
MNGFKGGLMKRRTCLKTMFALGAAVSVRAAGSATAVQLHVDLTVDPAKEAQMLTNFETIFRPEAKKHPGYIDSKMLKLRSTLRGSNPAGMNYRFSLTYASEELRQKWVASPEHKRVWPLIVEALSSKDFIALLFDMA